MQSMYTTKLFYDRSVLPSFLKIENSYLFNLGSSESTPEIHLESSAQLDSVAAWWQCTEFEKDKIRPVESGVEILFIKGH